MAIGTDSTRGTPSVLIVGAGPTGLLLAFALARQGIAVCLIDAKSGPAEESRAIGVQARTLEFYRQFGLADEAVALGIKAAGAHFYVNGREKAVFSLADMGTGLSAYNFLLMLPQDIHERFLLRRLKTLGVEVRWNTALETLTQTSAEVSALLRHASGATETITVAWLVGCDGATSVTRHALGIGFSGGTNSGLFYVADVDTGGTGSDLRIGMGAGTLALMFPVRATGTQRLIGIVPKSLEARTGLTFADVGAAGAKLLDVAVRGVNWFSTYHVHHRVADHFRLGRCFLAGDAGHIHSPVGGQGMNTGLGDAVNLGWKLAEVIKGQASSALLDTYESERMPFARTLIATTDRAFGALTADTALARLLRLYVLPGVVRAVTRWPVTRRLMFKVVSQTRIAYRSSAISRGRTGAAAGGDRLPFVAEIDNYSVLDGARWQLHVYGAASPALLALARSLDLTVQTFAPSSAAAKLGLGPAGAYLIRPDGHIGLVMPNQDPAGLAGYVKDLGLRFAPAAAALAAARRG